MHKVLSDIIKYIMLCCLNSIKMAVTTFHIYSTCTVGRIQEAKNVERWPNTTSAWAGWSRFDIPVDRYGRVRSQQICTRIPLGSSTCHQASQQGDTYGAKYQKADRASTLVTLWVEYWKLQNNYWTWTCLALEIWGAGHQTWIHKL